MKPLALALCLCLSLALTWADDEGRDVVYLLDGDAQDGHHEHDGHVHVHAPDPCQGLEMDAVTVNEAGVPYFFKDDFIFKGFHGKAELINQTHPELVVEEKPVHLDDVVRIIDGENPQAHDRMVFFVDDKVFRYFQNKLEDGYPKPMTDDFPGIPDHIDAAVECPKAECGEDTVIIFKEKDIFHFHLKTKAVHKKEFDSMPRCTSALRFMEHYYCFHGHMFSKFDPKTGFVHGRYPKEARDYFMKCPKFSNQSDHMEREQCSHVHLDAITGDGAGNMYAFRGHHFLFKGHNDTMRAGLIASEFTGLLSDVDAAFVYKDLIHIIKGDQMFKYRMDEAHTPVDGSPQPVREEIGMDGPVDAVFLCDDEHAHFIKGPNMISVNMKTTPPTVLIEHPIFSFPKVNAAMCRGQEVTVIVGNLFYNFKSPMDIVSGAPTPTPHSVSTELFGCDH